MNLQERPGKLGQVFQEVAGPPIDALLRGVGRVYHWLMKTFSAPNGREVSETVTASGVTGFMDTSIPKEALEGWRAQLLRRMTNDTETELAELQRLSRNDKR